MYIVDYRRDWDAAPMPATAQRTRREARMKTRELDLSCFGCMVLFFGGLVVLILIAR